MCFPREMEVQSEVAFIAVEGIERILDQIVPVAQVGRASAVYIRTNCEVSDFDQGRAGGRHLESRR